MLWKVQVYYTFQKYDPDKRIDSESLNCGINYFQLKKARSIDEFLNKTDFIKKYADDKCIVLRCQLCFEAAISSSEVPLPHLETASEIARRFVNFLSSQDGFCKWNCPVLHWHTCELFLWKVIKLKGIKDKVHIKIFLNVFEKLILLLYMCMYRLTSVDLKQTLLGLCSGISFSCGWPLKCCLLTSIWRVGV